MTSMVKCSRAKLNVTYFGSGVLRTLSNIYDGAFFAKKATHF